MQAVLTMSLTKNCGKQGPPTEFCTEFVLALQVFAVQSIQIAKLCIRVAQPLHQHCELGGYKWANVEID